MVPPIPPHQEGRFAIVTDVGVGCDGRGGVHQTRHANADGKSAWSRSPDAGINP